MPYQESSFLDGLSCGLAATDGRPMRAAQKTLLTGISRVSVGSVLNASYDTFVSRVAIRTDSPVTLLYEYGPADAISSTLEIRKVAVSSETQYLYHVCQIPQALPMRNFRYSVHLLEREDMDIRFDARFMSFPYQSDGQSWTYPGAAEQVNVWWTRTVR